MRRDRPDMSGSNDHVTWCMNILTQRVGDTAAVGYFGLGGVGLI